jgi:hypothetical protein
VQQPRSGRTEGVTAGAGARVEGARDPRCVPAAAAPEDLGFRRAPDSPPEPGHSGSMLHVRGATGLARRRLLPWKGGQDDVALSSARLVRAGQLCGTRCATRAGMRARSYHASPGEVMSVGGCAQGLWMNCASTPGWRRGARSQSIATCLVAPGGAGRGPERPAHAAAVPAIAAWVAEMEPAARPAGVGGLRYLPRRAEVGPGHIHWGE